MSTAVRRHRLAAADRWVAASAVVVFGAGLVLGLAGTAASEPGVLLAGGAVAAAGLAVLLAARWLDCLVPVAIALPLPAFYSTEALRLSPAAAVTLVVVTAWAVGRGLDPRPLRLGSLPRRSVLALLGAVGISAVFAAYPLPALRELTTFVLLAGLLAVAVHELSVAPRRGAALAKLIAATAAVTGALAALQAVEVVPGEFPLGATAFHRANLGFGGPTELAMYLAIAVPFAVYAVQAARSMSARLAAVAGLGATVLGLAATFTRGSWLAVVVATVVLLPLRRYGFVVRVAAAAAIALLVLTVATGGATLERLTGLAGDWIVEQRAAVMLAGLVMFAENPIVGVGPGGFGEHLERFGPEVSWLWDYGTSAHNTYIHMAAETGALGLAALVAFLGVTLLAILRGARAAQAGQRADEANLRAAALWAFGTACAVSMVEWSFAHGIGQLIVLVAAVGLMRPNKAPGEAPEAEREPGAFRTLARERAQ